jgi:hypothetical protein
LRLPSNGSIIVPANASAIARHTRSSLPQKPAHFRAESAEILLRQQNSIVKSDRYYFGDAS